MAIPEIVVLIDNGERAEERWLYLLDFMSGVPVDIYHRHNRLGGVLALRRAPQTASIVIMGNCDCAFEEMTQGEWIRCLQDELEECGVPKQHIILAGDRTPEELETAVREIIACELEAM